MDQLLNTVKSASSSQYAKAGLGLFLVLYSSLARPQLPQFIMDLFDSAVFRLIVLTMIGVMSNQSIELSVMVAIAFTITMNLLNEQKIAEGFVEGMRGGMIEENFYDGDADADSEGFDTDSDSDSE